MDKINACLEAFKKWYEEYGKKNISLKEKYEVIARFLHKCRNFHFLSCE